jgi:hypothetical protein
MKLCIQGVAFEAHGTLFDVHLVIAMQPQVPPGEGRRTDEAFATKHLERKCKSPTSGIGVRSNTGQSECKRCDL